MLFLAPNRVEALKAQHIHNKLKSGLWALRRRCWMDFDSLSEFRISDCETALLFVVGHGTVDCGSEALAGLDGQNQTGTATAHPSATRSVWL